MEKLKQAILHFIKMRKGCDSVDVAVKFANNLNVVKAFIELRNEGKIIEIGRNCYLSKTQEE